MAVNIPPHDLSVYFLLFVSDRQRQTFLYAVCARGGPIRPATILIPPPVCKNITNIILPYMDKKIGIIVLPHVQEYNHYTTMPWGTEYEQ